MKMIHAVCVAGALAGTCAVAIAGVRAQGFAPPTSADLGLGGSEAAQWDSLRADTLQQRAVARADVQREMAALQTLLSSNTADFDTFAGGIDREVDAHLAASRALRDRKLAFYRSLAPEAQARLHASASDRLDRLTHLRAAMLEMSSSF